MIWSVWLKNKQKHRSMTTQLLHASVMYRLLPPPSFFSFTGESEKGFLCFCNSSTSSFPVEAGFSEDYKRLLWWTVCHHNLHWEPRCKTTAQAQSHCCRHRGRHGVNQSHSNGDHTPYLLSPGHKHICRYVHWRLGFLFPANRHFLIWLAASMYAYKSDLTTVFFLYCPSFKSDIIFASFTVYHGCCRSYMKTRISFKGIKGYSVQMATEMCPINAIMWVSISVLRVLYNVLNNIWT